MASQTDTAVLKFSEIIANSHSHNSKDPSVYQLPTTTEKSGSLTRVTVGKKSTNKPNRTLLLVGETGTGKSTLVDALFNYSMGVMFEDKVWFQIVVEEEESSRKSDVIVYQIFGFEEKTMPFSLTIIDTPGYGDTRGIQHDDKVSQMLFELLQSHDGIPELHAVGLVMKASDNLVSDRLKYIFNSVVSLFGTENTVALVTHSDGMPPHDVLEALEKAHVECSKNEKDQFVHFVFNNQQKTQRTEENDLCLENAWRVSQRGLGKMKVFLEHLSPKNIKLLFELLAERARLVACIHNLQDRIRFTELKLRDVHVIHQELKKHADERKTGQFRVTGTEVFKDTRLIRTASGQLCEAAVYCPHCEENCHYPGCTMGLSCQQCEVMKDGNCTSCSNKCPASDHVKDNQKYVIRTKISEKTEEKLKKRYDHYQADIWSRSSLLENLEKETKKLSAERTHLLNKAFQHAVKLSETKPIKVNVTSTHILLDFLIQRMKEKGDEVKTKKLKEIDDNMDNGTRAALQDKMKSITLDYEDLISDSLEIISGPPAVYQLRTKKEILGTLTSITVGQKEKKKPNKTILLVGETGTGKSTLINALVNHAIGVKNEDEVWFQIVEEEKRDQTQSQTCDVIVYQIFLGQTLPFSLTIIDTPGFGDTGGPERDVLISQRLLDLFRSENDVKEIHAVGLVMKASDNRLTDRLMYTFDSVMSLFGKDLEKHIVALVTHSDKKTPENALKALKVANIKCAKDENNQPVYFMFDNNQKKGTTENSADLSSWDFTSKQIGMFIDYLMISKPQALKTTAEVLNERIRLSACIQNLKERVELIEQKQNNIKQIREVLKKHEKDMEKNKDFFIEVDENYKDKDSIDTGMWALVFFEGAVCCNKCKENCHYPGCTMAWYPEHCEVMKNGHCTVCTGKCPASAHVKENKQYVTKTRKVKKTVEAMKREYENNKAECVNNSSLLENLEREAENLSAGKSQCLDEAYRHVLKLEQIALHIMSVSTFVHMDFLIEKMEEQGDTQKVKKLKELKNATDERKLKSVQSYMSAFVSIHLKNKFLFWKK